MEALYRKVEELIKASGKKNGLALDVGCGTGYNTSKLKKVTPHIFGLDIENLVKKEFKKDFKFILGDGRKMPFGANSFDLITCWDVIEHLEEDEKLLQEIFRVLKPGGIVFLSTPNRKRFSNRLMGLFKKIEYPYNLGRNNDVGEIIHLREYVHWELEDKAKKVGFKVKKREGLFLGLVGIGGFYQVPKIFESFTQHIFLTLMK